MAESNTKLIQRAAEIAWTQNRTIATPGNYLSNPKFNEYLSAVGRGGGLDYCMAFIYWAFSKAASELGTANPLDANGLKTAHVPTFFTLAKSKNLVVDTPRPGDIGVVKDLSHAAFVLRIVPDDPEYPHIRLNPPVPMPDLNGCDMVTIEGNTAIEENKVKLWGVFKRSKRTANHFFVRV